MSGGWTPCIPPDNYLRRSWSSRWSGRTTGGATVRNKMSLSTGEHILSFKLPTQSPPPACWEALPLGAVDSGVSERAPRCLRCTTRVRSGQQAPCHFPRAVKKGGFGHGRTCLPSAALFRGVCECGCISRMLTGAHTQRRWAPSFTSCAVRGFRARGSGESRRLPKPRPEARGQTRLPLEIAQSELVIPAECDLGDSGIQSKSVTISQLVAFFFLFVSAACCSTRKWTIFRQARMSSATQIS